MVAGQKSLLCRVAPQCITVEWSVASNASFLFNCRSPKGSTNIAVLYKYCGALQILRCAAPTNIAVRCTCKYYGALHLQICNWDLYIYTQIYFHHVFPFNPKSLFSLNPAKWYYPILSLLSRSISLSRIAGNAFAFASLLR